MNPTGSRNARVVFVGGRELRTIPKGWRHPEDAGRPRPLLPEQMPGTASLALKETEIVAYEAVSEGTPISPPFPNTLEGQLGLVEYCSRHCTTFGDNKADAEAWAAILFGQNAAVTADGVVLANDN